VKLGAPGRGALIRDQLGEVAPLRWPRAPVAPCLGEELRVWGSWIRV